MVMQSIEQLQCISRDFADIKEKVEMFVKWANDRLEPENLDFVEETFPVKRRKLTKSLDGEFGIVDNSVTFSKETKFTVEVHNVTLDLISTV